MKTRTHTSCITVLGGKDQNEYYYVNQVLLEIGVLVKYCGASQEEATREYPTFVWFNDSYARIFIGRFNRRDRGQYQFVSPKRVVDAAVDALEGYTTERDVCTQIACFLSTDGPGGRRRSLYETERLRQQLATVISMAVFHVSNDEAGFSNS
jgi:hypothetical protein